MEKVIAYTNTVLETRFE